MRASVAFTSAGAGSATLPLGSVYAIAGQGFILREVAIFNTVATAARFQLVRLTSAGTQGAGLTENKFFDPNGPAPVITAFQTHTVAPTLGTVICSLPCGAAIGAGTIRTFYGENNGIYVPLGVGNGIGIVSIGTGQIADIDFIWDE